MKKMAFTLAEVLITLTVIGVIATMTIPTLMQNTKGEEHKAALKKAVSSLNQAVTMHYALEGNPAARYNSASGVVQSLFKKTMDVVDNPSSKIVAAGVDKECEEGPNQVFTLLDGMVVCVTNNYTVDECKFDEDTPCVVGAEAIDPEAGLPDGTEGEGSASEEEEENVDNNANSLPPNMFVDVNGPKNPNKLTERNEKPQDIFPLMLYSRKVTPWGSSQRILYGEEL